MKKYRKSPMLKKYWIFDIIISNKLGFGIIDSILSIAYLKYFLS